jgi:hypothetical protein
MLTVHGGRAANRAGCSQQFNMYSEGFGFARTWVIDFFHHFARFGLWIVVDLHVIHNRSARNALRVDQIEPVLVGVGFEEPSKNFTKRIIIGDTVLLGYEARVVN